MTPEHITNLRILSGDGRTGVEDLLECLDEIERLQKTVTIRCKQCGGTCMFERFGDELTVIHSCWSEQQRKTFAQFQSEIETLEGAIRIQASQINEGLKAIAQLRKAIADAPHAPDCDLVLTIITNFWREDGERQGVCDCWKAAFAQPQKSDFLAKELAENGGNFAK